MNYLAPVVADPRPAAGAAREHSRAHRQRRLGRPGAAADFDDVEFTRGYDGFAAYCRAKFALAAHTFALAEELADTGVSVNVLHPATFMDTAMVREGGVAPWTRSPTARRACWPSRPGSRGTRRLLRRHEPARAHEATYDKDVRKRLSAVTDQLLAL